MSDSTNSPQRAEERKAMNNEYYWIRYSDKTAKESFSGFASKSVCDEVMDRNIMAQFGGKGHDVVIKSYMGPFDLDYVKERKKQDSHIRVKH